MTDSDDDGAVTGYRYELPAERIARRPLDDRDASRLLILRGEVDAPEHGTFADLVDLLDPGDRLVVNDSRVIPARLLAERAGTGGRVEVLLCRVEDDGTAVCLVSPSRRLKPGHRLVFGAAPGGVQEPFFATVVGRIEAEPGALRLRFEGDALAYAELAGHVPIPPYLERDDDEDDRERYQTVYADPEKPGSAAAPTAGLHFTPELLAALEKKGVGLSKVTLHVGPGTFAPVRTKDLGDHQMHTEPWWVDETAAAAIEATRQEGGRIVCVGTTAVRVLESAAADDGVVRAGMGLTRLFIRPGYAWRVADAMVTNFHLPESTLLMLVAAFVGRTRVLQAYEEAIAEGYRFFSYGDACYFERAQG